MSFIYGKKPASSVRMNGSAQECTATTLIFAFILPIPAPTTGTLRISRVLKVLRRFSGIAR